MTSLQAIEWLRQVNGQLYRNNRHQSGRQTWVAVVRTPSGVRRNRKLIIALGSTMEEAAAAAEGQWQQVWGQLSRTH
jgi:glycine/D-amino acid oxidase-like deaminating enzyme